ncbi:MAG: 3'(2'),5'-bisphosphate nucleotidase [Chloroflexi bacterium]|nr:3'(2'),5'-bisphosphate nucleotidase [Chloroflexota bacterium]
MIDLGNPDVNFALEAVRQAAMLVKQIQSEMVSPALTKDDRSPVTVADFSSQALIGGLLSKRFPQDVLVAEESSEILRQAEYSGTLEQILVYVSRNISQANAEQVCRWMDMGTAEPKGRYWVLDPIDGTKGFLRGDQYVVALALIEGGEVQLGVLGCPNLVDAKQSDFSGTGSLVIARRGRGTWVTPLEGNISFRRLSVSPRKETSEARILRSFEDAHTNAGQIDGLAQMLGTRADPVRLDSQAKYVLLASGEADLSIRMLSPGGLDYREKIWDQAAGSIIVEEAGGKITDLDGKRLDFTKGRTLADNRGVLASNGHFHDAALQAVKVVEAYE